MRNIVVTSGDLRADYNIISPIFVHLSNEGFLKKDLEELEDEYQDMLCRMHDKGLLNLEQRFKDKRGFSDEVKPLVESTSKQLDVYSFIALEELKKKCRHLDADAVVYFRQEVAIRSSYFYIQSYGTAVRTT